MTHRMRAGLVGFMLALAACGASSEAGPEVNDSTTTTEFDAEAVDKDQAVSTTDPENTCDAGGCVDEFDPDVEVFEGEYTGIDNGLHRFENLGTEFTIQISEPTSVQPNEPARIVFTTPASQGPGDDDLILFRPTRLSDPADLGNDDAEPFDSSDISGWLDRIDPGLEIVDPGDVEVGGRTAFRFDLQLNPAYECGLEICAFFAFSQLAAVWFDPGQYYRVWHFPQGDEAPILLIAGTRSADDDWLRQVDDLMEGLQFGPIEPHPIPPDLILWEAGLPADVPAGIVTLPLAGGMTFELNEDRFIFQTDGYAAIDLPDQPGQNDILMARSTQAGPIDSLASAVERLQEHPGIEVIATEQVTVGANEAVKVTVEGRSSPVLSWRDPFDQDTTWFPPSNGTLWFIDIGDTSPLLVTSETFGGIELLELTDATAELLLSTLTIG